MKHPTLILIALLIYCILATMLLTQLSGCTLHFKATDLEIDAERQRVQNQSYYLDSIDILKHVDKKKQLAKHRTIPKD